MVQTWPGMIGPDENLKDRSKMTFKGKQAANHCLGARCKNSPPFEMEISSLCTRWQGKRERRDAQGKLGLKCQLNGISFSKQRFKAK